MTAVLFRLWTYETLAQLFDGSPEALAQPPDPASTAQGLTEAANAVRLAVEGTPADDTSADHARLFVNSPHGVSAPPYASWYLDRQLIGPSTQWVERAYAEQGLEREADSGEPSDYLGSELEFLHFLARHELAARSTADDASLRLVLAAEKTFVLNHLARWLPAFIANIRAAEPGPVFAAAAELLGAIVQDDVSRLSTDYSKSAASSQR
jgi:TorA maturation chaperone TorD